MRLPEYRAVVDVLEKTYDAKNHDYGDSFGESVKEWGLLAAVVRLDDKMRRLKTLARADAKVPETVYDTLQDMANYCIMALMELELKKKE